jgi:CRP-like cAMP-binding protein
LQQRAKGTVKNVDRTDKQKRAIRNAILSAIPEKEFQLIRPALDYVVLDAHQSLHEPHDLYKYAYFPNDGLISLVITMSNGKTVEAGIVGREGVTGMPAVAGLSRSPWREVVQIAGDGFRVPAHTLERGLRAMPLFDRTLKRYTLILGLQVAQTAACNRLHEVERRLARWLLMAQDRVNSSVLRITHDFLATMLGTDRPSVTLAAGIFQKLDIIRYSRGAVEILNRGQLEKSACECYGVIQKYAD